MAVGFGSIPTLTILGYILCFLVPACASYFSVIGLTGCPQLWVVPFCDWRSQALTQLFSVTAAEARAAGAN